MVSFREVCRRFSLWPLMFAVVVLLVSCGGKMSTVVDFYGGERWKAVTEITIPNQALSIPEVAEEIKKRLTDAEMRAKQEGVRFSWRDRNDEKTVTYEIEVEGTGLELLSRTVFDGNARIYRDDSSGRSLIRFQRQAGFDLDVVESLTLRGGEIVSGNGRFLDNRTMIWENQLGPIEATIAEGSRVNVLPVIGIGFGIVVALGVIVMGVRWWQNSRRLPGGLCPWCDAWVPEGDHYCPECGEERW